MIIKEIPEIISISTSIKRLTLPRKRQNEMNLVPEAFEKLEEIKNTPVSGIVIKRVDPFGNAEVYDPRGFTCHITNFNELLEKVDISRGVIQEDLWYGLKNTRDVSWILLTAEMKNQSKKAIQSVKDLKPGYVYKLYNNLIVYLGRIKWKDNYGTLRPHHTFVNPKTREITYQCYLKGSDFEELGYDDPDVYNEAMSVILSSYQGSAEVKVSQISLKSDLKYTTYHHSLLMPDKFKELKLWENGSRVIMFVKQFDDKSIRGIRISSHAYRCQTNESRYCRLGQICEKVDKTEYSIDIEDILMSVNNGMVEISNNHQYCRDVDFDLNDLELLKNIVKDPSYKCLDISDRSMWEKVYCFNFFRGARQNDIFDCILNNGDKKSYSSIINNSINF